MRTEELRLKVTEMLLGRGHSTANPEALRKAVDNICDVVHCDCAEKAKRDREAEEKAAAAAEEAAASANKQNGAPANAGGKPGNPPAAS